MRTYTTGEGMIHCANCGTFVCSEDKKRIPDNCGTCEQMDSVDDFTDKLEFPLPNIDRVKKVIADLTRLKLELSSLHFKKQTTINVQNCATDEIETAITGVELLKTLIQKK